MNCDQTCYNSGLSNSNKFKNTFTFLSYCKFEFKLVRTGPLKESKTNIKKYKDVIQRKKGTFIRKLDL